MTAPPDGGNVGVDFEVVHGPEPMSGGIRTTPWSRFSEAGGLSGQQSLNAQSNEQNSGRGDPGQGGGTNSQDTPKHGNLRGTASSPESIETIESKDFGESNAREIKLFLKDLSDDHICIALGVCC